MIKWGSAPQKARTAKEQFERHPIVTHSVMFMRETNPTYNPHEGCMVEEDQVAPPSKKTGRGVGVKTIVKDNNESCTRRALAADLCATNECDSGGCVPLRNASTRPNVPDKLTLDEPSTGDTMGRWKEVRDAIPKAKTSDRKRKRTSVTKFVVCGSSVTNLFTAGVLFSAHSP